MTVAAYPHDIQPPLWTAIRSVAGGQRLVLFVLQDALKTPDGVRFKVTEREVQAWADALGALPVTDKIEDLAYDQAAIQLRPHIQRLDKGENDEVRHSREVDAEIGGRVGLARPVGKSWILGDAGGRRALNYGWHSYDAPYLHRGRRVWQQPGTRHSDEHEDYSQTLACLVKRVCLLGPEGTDIGEERDLEDIYRDPVLSRLVSYTGPLRTVRLVP